MLPLERNRISRFARCLFLPCPSVSTGCESFGFFCLRDCPSRFPSASPNPPAPAMLAEFWFLIVLSV
ncbi:hypothetical protein SLEP1_g55183 [Rubroshorea leprosula]|uniref:Secreted protein n=1 Tax=Rubroshorea leprosula TaxID=152421 RepID=A0AAV5MGR9_9ROSI|nr:hypothetical protein SLEP1_g55183 [Rubroshorea leprosula]